MQLMFVPVDAIYIYPQIIYLHLNAVHTLTNVDY